jgi:5'(3')-deoxyribonucleotidase
MNTIGKKWREVISRFLPMIHHNDIIVTHYKNMIMGDVLIDDAPFNFDGGNCYNILFDAPHNRNEESSGFVRARNWDEVYHYIQIVKKMGFHGWLKEVRWHE